MSDDVKLYSSIEEKDPKKGVLAKMNRGQEVSKDILKKLGEDFDGNTQTLFASLCDQTLLSQLKKEKSAPFPGSLYELLQIEMAYHSNSMEGNTLSKEQTSLSYKNPQFFEDPSLPSDDLIEMINHFQAFEAMIEMAEFELNEGMIKQIHQILLQNTSKVQEGSFIPGEYKKRSNYIADQKTTLPRQVESRMNSLLSRYNALKDVSLEDIVSFHAEFERIHPFQDGNGRTGRLIALKECLKNNLPPFLIEESKRAFYYRGLAQWSKEKGFLIGTFQDGQYTLKKLAEKRGLSL